MYSRGLQQGCVFDFAPYGLGTKALGAQVKTGDKLGELSVISVSSVRDLLLLVVRSVVPILERHLDQR